ncbi:hypothetical protein LL295_01875 [Vibrio campbellii]|uniref:hypothetical protein n=1 Tax=Vibrio campbellii TaxID=680 RepID=UPI0010717195|nr:hypothetical protein [Vibrio campbellii]MCC4222255.1 hypothetical protein [Vibrio campbellii]
MKKIRYPFDLHGTLSIRYRDKVNPIFLDTDEENQSIINIDDFAVRSFSIAVYTSRYSLPKS